MTTWSACIEMLFAPETDTFIDRIGMAADAGFEYVEFWRWTNKDVPAVAEACARHGVKVTSLVAEPMIWLTDPANHDAFLEGLEKSITAAQRLGAPVLIAQAGDERADIGRNEQAQAVVDVLARAADILEGTGVTLTLEPLNIHVDHPGYYLSSTAEGLDIIDRVGRPEIRLLYDIYHSAVMGEVAADVLAGRVDRIGHVHLADAPGRHEPNSGTIGWQEIIRHLQAQGYDGPVGLEYRPSEGTLHSLRKFL